MKQNARGYVERLWRSLKYEEVYLKAFSSVAEAKAGIGSWLGYQTLGAAPGGEAPAAARP
jgi:hypothetical protein